MKSFLPARRRGSVVATLTVGAVAAALALDGLGTDGTEVETASSVASAPTIALTQMDGTPPFDPSAVVGGDSGPSNGAVRSGDRVAFVVDIGHGPAGITDAMVTLPIWKGLTLESVPEFCRPGSTLVPIGVMSVLNCALGDLAPHERTTQAVSVRTSSTPMAPDAVITTSATLSGTSPITFVMSNATRLQFAQRPAGCDPHGVEAESDPAIRQTPDRVQATGQIRDVVLDESGAPVSGAVVTLTGQDRCGDLIDRQIATDGNGRFAFVGLVAGHYQVSASAALGASEPRLTPTVAVDLSGADMTATALDLRLTPADAVAAESVR